jgi:acylphosphatase
VQGVGFRATTHSIARNFDVAGFVRNLPDGSVELIAEGFPRELQAFLDAIGERMDGYIDRAEAAEVAAEEELQDFRIRY